MRAGRSVLMQHIASGKIKPVAVEDSSFFKERGFKVVSRPLQTKDETEKWFQEQVATPAKQFAGNALPVAAAMGAGAVTGGMAWPLALGVEGLVAGAAKYPGDILAGREAPTPKQMAIEGGITAATGGASRLISKGIAGLARPAMKGALGAALPGTEDAALKAGQVVSTGGLAQREGVIKAARDQAQAAIDAAPNTFNWRVFRRAVGVARSRAAKNDLASEATENALTDVLNVLESKVGPKVTTTPASTILAPGRGTVAATSGAARPSVTTVTPAKPLTARDVEDIRFYADEQVRKIRDAREAMKVTSPGAEELAYIKIGDVARKMLSQIPEVKAARAIEAANYPLRNAVFESLKRGQGGSVHSALTGGIVGAQPGVWAHDPITGIAGGLMGAGTGLFVRSPEGLSRIALAANNPAVQKGIGTLPRALQLLVESQQGE